MDTSSDYGSDTGFDDLDEDSMLTVEPKEGIDSGPTPKNSLLPRIAFERRGLGDGEQDVDDSQQILLPPLLPVSGSLVARQVYKQASVQASVARQRRALEIEYDASSRRAWSVTFEDRSHPLSTQSQFQSYSHSSSNGRMGEKSEANIELPMHRDVENGQNDTRPPLERFRTKPKKPLSVTDLVSPAWCELQYFYVLSKFGRKPQTHAMRSGSKLHQKLEDEVHFSVPVQVQTKEDRFGLRLWNSIAGLRCLRETGLTRELEIWGVLHGEVVNGVIDELSYLCPDVAFEESLNKSQAEGSGGTIPLPSLRANIQNTFTQITQSQDSIEEESELPAPDLQIYIADVKTRSVPSLPTGASLRPARMQLMLYRKLLESLSLNTVDAETVLGRYSLAPLDRFSQTFMGEMTRLHSHDESSSYPNLLSLWALLVTETQLTLTPDILSPILRIEFRCAITGNIIGSKLVVYEADTIDEYIAEEMAWWKGLRDAKGVDIEEAFKCKACDFAEDCRWRKSKVQEAIEKSRLKRQARDKSAV